MSEQTITITLELTERELGEFHMALVIRRGELIVEHDKAGVRVNSSAIAKLIAAQSVAGEWKDAG